MTVFPPGEETLVPAHQSECFHRGGHRNLQWDDGFLAKGEAVRLMPGEALLVPVKAPHFVQNGPAVSISFSIPWRSGRSEIGRASCRERVCQYGVDLGGRRILNKKKHDQLADQT